MEIVSESGPLRFNLNVSGTDWSVVYEDRWRARAFTPTWEIMMDLRNVWASTGWTMEVIPALRFAAARTDRPDQPILAAGTPKSSDGVYHFTESPSGLDQKGYVQFGVAARITGGSGVGVGRATVFDYRSWRPQGRVFAPEAVVINPYNDNLDIAAWPLGRGRPFPLRTLDKLGLIVVVQGNAVATMDLQALVRAFNDPQARGDWTAAGSVHTPATGDSSYNFGVINLPAGITFSDYQFGELALGVKRSSGAASRCMIQAVGQVKYT